MIYKTEKCVICSRPALCWHGCVKGFRKRFIPDRNIIAGFCEEHKDVKNKGCYGRYSRKRMGELVPWDQAMEYE